MNAMRTNQVTVSLAAIAHNTRVLRAQVPSCARLLAVVKADAYGHGAEAVSRTVLENGCDMLAVAIAEEGVALRMCGVRAPILVLGAMEDVSARAVAEYGLIQTVFTTDAVRLLGEAAHKTGRTVAVHMKLDTGMGRIGVQTPQEAEALAQCIKATAGLCLTGAFTHFATADDADDTYLRRQCARFEAFAAPLRAQNPGMVLHAANSATILRYPSLSYDMVRAGIVLYGAPPVSCALPLVQAMRWHTRAVHVKTLAPDEGVSYGRTYTTARETRVMTLPVGYADGYRRALSNRAQVLVRGRRAPVIGRVCMDQTMVDVTDIPDAQVGDEAVLLGAQGTDCISAQELAEWADTISYEMFLSPTPRVTRVTLPI
ncbi:MAG: alanine racemase [Clostridia bacterium]